MKYVCASFQRHKAGLHKEIKNAVKGGKRFALRRRQRKVYKATDIATNCSSTTLQKNNHKFISICACAACGSQRPSCRAEYYDYKRPPANRKKNSSNNKCKKGNKGQQIPCGNANEGLCYNRPGRTKLCAKTKYPLYNSYIKGKVSVHVQLGVRNIQAIVHCERKHETLIEAKNPNAPHAIRSQEKP